MSKSPERKETFENTYPKHSFSELIRLSLKLAQWVRSYSSAENENKELEQTRPPRFGRHSGA